MAFTERANAMTFPVGAALGANLFVILNSSGQVAAAGAGGDAVGVTAEAVSAQEFTDGKVVTSVVGGEFIKVKVQAAASTAILVGEAVASDASGNVVPTGVGDSVLGIALEAAGSDADQELITVLLSKEARLEV